MVRQNNPNKRRQAFKLLAEHFYKSHTWPRKIRTIVYENTNCNNQERFVTYVFFLNNGLSPDLTYEVFNNLWILDNDSERQIKWLRQQWNNNWHYKSWQCEPEDQGLNWPSSKWRNLNYARDKYEQSRWERSPRHQRETDIMSDSE